MSTQALATPPAATAAATTPSAAPTGRIVVASAAESSGRDFTLWNKEVVPFARDLLFVFGVFAYLIGFANHNAKMAQFGMETQLGDQPLSSLFTWALEAVISGGVGFAVIFAIVATLLLLAGYVKHRFVPSAACRTLVYGIVALAITGGVVFSFAWSSAVGICNAKADLRGVNSKKGTVVRFNVNPQTNISGFPDHSATAHSAMLLAETSDAYQVLVFSSSRLIPMIIPRSEVASVEYSSLIANDTRRPIDLPNNRNPGPNDLPTPNPSQSGADAQSEVEVAGGSSRVPSSCLPGMSI